MQGEASLREPAGPIGRPPWRIRRRVIFGTLLFCAVFVGWLAVAGEDTALNQSIANGLILLAGGVVGSYVFGAAWDDLNVMKTLGVDAYRVSAPGLPQDPPPGFPQAGDPYP